MARKIVITESSVRRDLQLTDEEGIEFLPNSTIFEQLALMGLGKGFSGKVTHLFQTMVQQLGEGSAIHTFVFTSLLDAVGIIAAQVYGTGASGGDQVKLPYDSPLSGGHTSDRSEGNLNLEELFALCTNLSNRVLALETVKDAQAKGILTLKARIKKLEKRRVKKLEKRNRARTHKLKRLYKVGLSAKVESFRDEKSFGEDASKQERMIDVIDADEDIILVNDVDNEMFDVDDLGGEEVFVAGQNENIVEEIVCTAQVSTAAITFTITTEEITLAQALKALKTSKPKVKGIVFQELGYKLKDLKLKELDKIQEMFDKAFRRVNTFEDFRPELVVRKEKRAREELEQEITKKQKVEDDEEKAELKQLIETIPNEEEVAIDDIPFAIKS
nr:hypothetical protein [Tanacetum cinerariifolium]